MKFIFQKLVLFSLITSLTLCFFACDKTAQSAALSIVVVDTSIEQGKYLVQILGCNDCHSPKILVNGIPTIDQSKLLSGHSANASLPNFDKNLVSQGILQFNSDGTAALGPWGISFGDNLTPDETGLDKWTFEQFKKALTLGKDGGLDTGRTLLPPMPWQNFSIMKDPDIKAIFNYLKSIKPISNVVPEPLPL